MNIASVVFTVLIGALALPHTATAVADLTLSTGMRIPSDSYLSKQAGAAIDAAWAPRSWPLQVTAYVAGYLEAHTGIVWPPQSDYVTGQHRTLTTEIGAGIGKTWSFGSFHPNLAGGVCLVGVQGRDSFQGVSFGTRKTHGYGPWLGAGGAWNVGDVRLGAGARYTRPNTGPDLNLDGTGRGTEIVLRVGKGWGD